MNNVLKETVVRLLNEFAGDPKDFGGGGSSNWHFTPYGEGEGREGWVEPIAGPSAEEIADKLPGAHPYHFDPDHNDGRYSDRHLITHVPTGKQFHIYANKVSYWSGKNHPDGTAIMKTHHEIRIRPVGHSDEGLVNDLKDYLYN